MSNHPLMSVIIPSYNRAFIVDNTINSVLQQTYPEKGITAMEMIFEKYKEKIFINDNILSSFFKKKAAFICNAGKNPVQEMELIYKKVP